MTEDQLEILRTIKRNHNSAHYRVLGQVRNDFRLALSYLVDKEYVEAYGSKEWEDAMFSLTNKGKDELSKTDTK